MQCLIQFQDLACLDLVTVQCKQVRQPSVDFSASLKLNSSREVIITACSLTALYYVLALLLIFQHQLTEVLDDADVVTCEERK